VTASPPEVLTIGRVSVDLYAGEVGVGLRDATAFVKSVGGSPTNVAVAAARLGRRAAVVTAVGADPFGAYVREALERRFGVDTRFVGTHPCLRTPLAFASPVRPDEPELLFYREPSAPDEWIGLEQVDLELARSVGVLWVSASCFAFAETGTTARAMLRARARRPHTCLDLDYRPTFWPDEATARREIGAMVEQATVTVGNRAECEIAVGSGDPDAAADALLERGVEVAVVKLGGEGVLVATPDERSLVPPFPVEVVCGLGAGDAFGGALCDGLLGGLPPLEAVERANAAGAIVASRLLCSDAMPTEPELLELVEARRAL
jgi:5-dehydro-2-deoxygluconokinase